MPFSTVRVQWTLYAGNGFILYVYGHTALEDQRRTLERKQMYIPKDNGTRQIRGLCEERIKSNSE